VYVKRGATRCRIIGNSPALTASRLRFAVEEEEVGVNASPARTALGVDLNLLGAKNETGRPKAERAGANESRCRSAGAARCERRLA
jgi:hypothetical protein